MTTIAEGAEILKRAKENGAITPVSGAGTPTAYPIPAAEPGLNPLLRGPLPASWGLNTDTARQWHNSALPQTRILPLPPTSNPVVGAQAQSQAIVQIASTPAAPAAASGVTSVGLTAPTSLFTAPVVGSPVTSAGTLALSFINPPFNTVFSAPANGQGTLALDTTNSTSYDLINVIGTGTMNFNTAATQANDFALLAYFQSSGVAPTLVNAGAPWISLQTPGNGALGVYWQNVAAAGAVTATVSMSVSSTSTLIGAGCILTAKTSGGTPNARQFARGAISGVAPGVVSSFNTSSNLLAGSTLFVILGPSNSNNPFVWGITDSQGNTYTQVSSVDVAQGAGPTHNQVQIFAATSTSGGACTVNVTNTSTASISATTVGLLEITNLAPPVLTPSFQPLTPAEIPGMGSGKLDLFHGGTSANLAATGGAHQYLAQLTAGAAITVQQPDFNDLAGAQGNLATQYGGVALVNNGLVTEVAKADLTAQAAAIAATTIFTTGTGSFGSPVGAGMYEISYVAKVTTAATASSTLGGATGFQITYTDNNDSVVVVTPAWWGGGNNGAAPTSASLNTTQTVISGTIVVNAKGGTNIQYAMGYTSSGATAMQYNLHIKLKALL